jgi:hypothetical protein
VALTKTSHDKEHEMPTVFGASEGAAGEGVHGESNSRFAATAGYNQADGPGVWGIGGPNGGEGVHGETRSGFAAVAGYNKGHGPAGWFEGNVVVKGELTVEGVNILNEIIALSNRIAGIGG